MRNHLVRIVAWSAIVWLIGVTAAPLAAGAEDPDEWVVSGVRNTDYWWHRSPPLVIDPIEAERLADDLDLDADQRAALTELIEATTDGFTGLWLECAESYDDTRYAKREESYRWRDIRREQRRQRDRYLASFEQGRQGVLADLEIILTTEQQEGWERAMRGHRRRTALAQYANIAGEAIDLTSLVSLLELDEAQTAAVEQPLRDYTLELDGLIRMRENARMQVDRACAKYRQARDEHEETEEWEKDFAKVQRKVTRDALKMWEVSRRIRRVNERYYSIVSAELPEPALEELHVMMAASSDPAQWYQRESRGVRMLKFAEALDSAGSAFQTIGSYNESRYYTGVARSAGAAEPLSAAQRREIVALREEYDRRQADLVHKHRMHEFADPPPNHITVRCSEGMVWLHRIEDPEKPRPDKDREEYNKAIAELGDETVAKLRDLLTMNQRILLQTRE